jgi:hypothetical protein
MSSYCHCDSCLFYGSVALRECLTPKTKEELLSETLGDEATMEDDQGKRCPGYTTSLSVHECNEECNEDICNDCFTERDRQLHLEDLAVEAWERRQVELEEFQGMEDHGDLDDGDEDGDREEEDQGPLG